MDTLIYIFAGAVLLSALLASISIWSAQRLWIRAGAIAVTAALMALAYAGSAELLSKPKPIHMEWAMSRIEEAQVLGSSTREGEAIFVWLQIPGMSEPRSYAMPWDRDLAQQLQDATQEAQGNRGGVRVRRPFERLTENDEPVFYAPAPQPPAPKDSASTGPVIFRQPG